MALDARELARYGRHVVIPEVGLEGQEKLKAARVLIVGLGGLGSPSSLYLAAAGVGKLGLVDFDVVDLSNLQRQILYGTTDVGRPKLDVARQRIHDINPHVELELFSTRLSADNAAEIFAGYDVILDGTDNFPTRYLVNEAGVLRKKPNVDGSILRFEGQASVFDARHGPCYRCLFPDPPPPGLVPSCAEGGVLGVLPGLMGTVQAIEAIKIILESGDGLMGRLLLFDALAMRFRELKLRKEDSCPVCGTQPSITSLQDYESVCGFEAPAVAEAPVVDISGGLPEGDRVHPVQLQALMEAGQRPFLLDVRESVERAICKLDDSLHIPLLELPQRLSELDPELDIVAYCKMGGRSAQACAWLRRSGFERVWNLDGGLDAWVEHVDPSFPRY